MTDEHLGAAICEDVGDLFGLEVPVDRHSIGSQHNCAECGLQKRHVISHQDGNTIAASYSKTFEPSRKLSGSRLALLVGDEPVAADNALGSCAHRPATAVNLGAVWIEQNGVTSSGSIEAAPRLFGNKVCDEK